MWWLETTLSYLSWRQSASTSFGITITACFSACWWFQSSLTSFFLTMTSVQYPLFKSVFTEVAPMGLIQRHVLILLISPWSLTGTTDFWQLYRIASHHHININQLWSILFGLSSNLMSPCAGGTSLFEPQTGTSVILPPTNGYLCRIHECPFLSQICNINPWKCYMIFHTFYSMGPFMPYEDINITGLHHYFITNLEFWVCMV